MQAAAMRQQQPPRCRQASAHWHEDQKFYGLLWTLQAQVNHLQLELEQQARYVVHSYQWLWKQQESLGLNSEQQAQLAQQTQQALQALQAHATPAAGASASTTPPAHQQASAYATPPAHQQVWATTASAWPQQPQQARCQQPRKCPPDTPPPWRLTAAKRKAARARDDFFENYVEQCGTTDQSSAEEVMSPSSGAPSVETEEAKLTTISKDIPLLLSCFCF